MQNLRKDLKTKKNINFQILNFLSLKILIMTPKTGFFSKCSYNDFIIYYETIDPIRSVNTCFRFNFLRSYFLILWKIICFQLNKINYVCIEHMI